MSRDGYAKRRILNLQNWIPLRMMYTSKITRLSFLVPRRYHCVAFSFARIRVFIEFNRLISAMSFSVVYANPSFAPCFERLNPFFRLYRYDKILILCCLALMVLKLLVGLFSRNHGRLVSHTPRIFKEPRRSIPNFLYSKEPAELSGRGER